MLEMPGFYSFMKAHQDWGHANLRKDTTPQELHHTAIRNQASLSNKWKQYWK